jgi:hypothetical protein
MAAGGPFSPAGPEGASAHLSPGGQTIARVLAAAADAAQPATAAVARTPLLNAPSENAGHLAAALRQGLEQSGLFYESHVAEWAQGLRARADLAAEPQGRGAMPSALAPDAAQFINLQLGVQEQGRIAWQGPLWPGQDLRWDIERHPARAGDDDDAGRGGAAAGADGTQWHSRLRLRFAGLGDVDAHLVLAGDRLHLRLDAGEDAAARMHAASSLLATALDAAGTPLASLAIHSAPGEPAAEPDGQG